MEHYSAVTIDEPTNGIPIENITNELSEKALEAITCPICSNLLWDIVDCKECGYIFCKNCINDSIQKINNSCPICQCSPFISSGCKALKNIFLNIHLKCPNESCEENIEYSEYINHISNCKYRKYHCANDGCDYENTVNNIKEMEKHSKICKYRIIKCNHCEKEMKELEYKNHLETQCSKIVHCKFCDSKMENWYYITKHSHNKTDDVKCLKNKVEHYVNRSNDLEKKLRNVVKTENDEKKENDKLRGEFEQLKEMYKVLKTANDELSKKNSKLQNKIENLNIISLLCKKRGRTKRNKIKKE